MSAPASASAAASAAAPDALLIVSRQLPVGLSEISKQTANKSASRPEQSSPHGNYSVDHTRAEPRHPARAQDTFRIGTHLRLLTTLRRGRVCTSARPGPAESRQSHLHTPEPPLCVMQMRRAAGRGSERGAADPPERASPKIESRSQRKGCAPRARDLAYLPALAQYIVR